MRTSNALIDDRLLVARAVGVDLAIPGGLSLHTTGYWYYRACRAAVVGGEGQLSGPFRSLDGDLQAGAIQAMLSLPYDIGLPGPRELVPAMVSIHRRHPKQNLLNTEAAAAARLLDAAVFLSPPSAAGVLTQVLDDESIAWTVIDPR